MEDGSQEQYKYHQLRNAINHLNKEGQHTFVLGKEISFNEGVSPSNQIIIPSENIVKANWMSRKLIFYSC